MILYIPNVAHLKPLGLATAYPDVILGELLPETKYRIAIQKYIKQKIDEYNDY